MKIVFLTAGAAGMYCGSCMHDNALAKALIRGGAECLLQPVYTPIRTDEGSIASDRVFFGGIHIYLMNRFPWMKHVPGPLMRLLDRPAIINLAAKRSHSTDPAELGDLAISMLRGGQGNQADEVRRLADWLADDIKPDAIVLSNLLIGGCIPEIRQRLPRTKVLVMLQGDDIFLDHLPTEARSKAIQLCNQLATHVDRFVVNSRFYGEKMGALLGIDQQQWDVHPLSIDLNPFEDSSDHGAEPTSHSQREKPFRLGYMARIAPEKGLHRLVEAFVSLASREEAKPLELHVAGWLGKQNEAYFKTLTKRVADAGLQDRFIHHGSPDLHEKVEFLRSLDLLSVPTEYEDPKGLFVLEALAAGVPVVQPDHGAFGELVGRTGGGLLYPCDEPHRLEETLAELINAPERRRELALHGHEVIKQNHGIDSAAKRLLELIDRLG